MRNYKVLSLILALLVALTAFFTGCSKGGNDSQGSSSSQSGTNTAPPAPVTPPVYETAADNLPPEGYTRKSFISCADGEHSYTSEPNYYFDTEKVKAYLSFNCANCFDNRLIEADLQILDTDTKSIDNGVTYNMSGTKWATASATVDGVYYTQTRRITAFHTESQIKVYTTAASNIWKIANGSTEKSKPLDTEFSWEFEGVTGGEYRFKLATDKSFENATVITTTEQSTTVTNLLVGQTYYWQVESIVNGQSTLGGIYEFATSCNAPRNLNIAGVTNARDLGGRFTASGNRVKQGLVYRTANLDALTKSNQTATDGLNTLKALGIKTQIDLRGNPDDDNIHYPLGEDVNYLYLPMTTKKGNIIETQENIESLIATFETLAHKNAYPVVFHCSIGTDRTGAVAFLFNALLGVDFLELKQDYIFSLYGKIGGNRNGDAIDDYRDILAANAPEAQTLQEQAYLYLTNVIGVHPYYLDQIIENMLY